MSSNLELMRKIAWDYKHYEKRQVELPTFLAIETHPELNALTVIQQPKEVNEDNRRD